ncbi:zinc finger MYM-type protein 1-like [Arachis ipaensis]|uniref:zinc finger MYM-type protein 1-like n=1 Tax=Arachis ipaensis TaxID=130454 RepID=UPI0007AF9893|nr:zinc finger MYM-type protein 1-like [Arachis ipaensis]
MELVPDYYPLEPLNAQFGSYRKDVIPVMCNDFLSTPSDETPSDTTPSWKDAMIIDLTSTYNQSLPLPLPALAFQNFRLLHKQTSEEIEKNRIRLGASIDCIRWLTFQGCAYRGHDESQSSSNKGNFLMFLKDSPQAYYVHCFAHRLQLALVAASREVLQIHEFFTQLNSIVTIVSASSKRHDQLQEAQAIENANLVVQNELETDKGANQISTLQRAGDTRWSSHFNSICSLVKMFTATNIVLNNIIEDGTTYAQRGEAYGVSKILLSFEFVFTLHLMKEIMGITNVLCQALQQQSQDILNAMHIVSTSKLLLQQLRDGGCQYVFGRGRSRQPSVTVEHHRRIDVFLATIDSQIQELNSRFNEQTIELLTLSCALDPKDNFKSFNIEEISKLAEKFYPLDFPSNELNILKSQLQHYQHDIPNHLKGIGTLSKLCNKLQETGKSRTYHMVDRLIRLVLTLPVSTATTEKAFSAMKIIKTRLRSKMVDEFLADNLVIYIEKELAAIFDTNSIIDDFENRKKRRIAFS